MDRSDSRSKRRQLSAEQAILCELDEEKVLHIKKKVLYLKYPYFDFFIMLT
jgi:hypothetical protein